MTTRTVKTKSLGSYTVTCVAPGVWRLYLGRTDVMFHHLDSTRLGHAGGRYTVQRWTMPHSDGTEQSLEAAVRKTVQRYHTGCALVAAFAALSKAS